MRGQARTLPTSRCTKGAAFGPTGSLIIGSDAAGAFLAGATAWRALYQFDISGLVIPAGQAITGAVLTLANVAMVLGTGNWACSRVTRHNWTTSATFTDYDGADAWTVPGGDFTDTGRGTFAAPNDTANLVFANLAVLALDAFTLRAGLLELEVRNLDETQMADLLVTVSSEAVLGTDIDDPAFYPTLLVTVGYPNKCGRATLDLGAGLAL